MFSSKSAASYTGTINSYTDSENQQLAEELYKPVIGKFKKRKIYPSFKGNIWSADLAGVQLISKYNKGIWFLLCVIDIFRLIFLVNRDGLFFWKTKKESQLVQHFTKFRWVWF